MNLIKEKYKGLLVCLAIAIPACILGKIFPIIGSAVIAIIAGMVIALFWQPGKTFIKKDTSVCSYFIGLRS